MTEFHKLGEQAGDFLRGLLHVKNADTAQQVRIPRKRKYVVVDATETSEGTTVSLDMDSDDTEVFGSLTKDITFNGVVHFRSGNTFQLQQVIAKHYADALSLQPKPDRTDTWNIVAGEDTQPLSQIPYEVKLLERVISGTSVVRISGQIFDPNFNKRVNFAVTHDPIETGVVLAVVAGFAALICGAVVLVEAATNHCTAQARLQCGDRGVRKIKLRRKYGFGWKKGGVDIGCGEECIIDCNL